MEEEKFGDRSNKGNYIPKKRVSYPPVFIWPLAPVRALKWVFSMPGYFLPWNLFYVGIGLISWFALSPPLEDYANLTIITCLSVFIKNSGLVLLFYGAFHYRLYIQRAQNIDFLSILQIAHIITKPLRHDLLKHNKTTRLTKWNRYFAAK